MPDAQLPLPPVQPHGNHQLFSDYYLNVLLPKQAAWQFLLPQAAEIKAHLVQLFAHYVPSNNEAQTERDWVQPVLEALGHVFDVQAHLRTPDGPKRPDYVFYRDLAALKANKNQPLTDALPQQGGYAVGDAKLWERPLDITLKNKTGDALSNKNPSFQIAFYMQHSGVEWGILTNGRLWRLYHKDTAHKLDRYYEIDLPALLETDDPEAFLYFFVFFRRAAFDEQPLGVAEILRASVEFARGIGESLKGQVFDALLHIAQGFLDYAPNALQADADTLKSVYDNALIVLYRLLFILYAEDRNLLPVRESGPYRQRYSLYAIKRGVAHDMKTGAYLLPDSTHIWAQMQSLFRIIDQGSPPLRVATFNGGLFDAKRHPFLEQHHIGDARLQRAIDNLARIGKDFVDYRDLSPRHLGTIYEGLLEFHLEAEAASTDGFTLALRNDKGERKATGSYYTPDYIVKYMTEQTLLPLLQQAVEGKTDDAACIEAVLSVNVLDPAMGSGHFLVEATEYIARFLVDIAVLPEERTAEEADLAYWKRRVVQSCIYGVDLNPLAVELAKLSLWLTTVAKDRPLSFLDHHLRSGNALVGARLAALQTATASHGGGRGGQKKQAKQEEAGQVSMLADDAFRQSMSVAVGNMWLIESSEARDVQQVKEQEELYRQLHADLTGKYGKLANLVTATHFGVSVDPKLWQPLADFATGRALTTLPELAEKLNEAEMLAARHRFFHWELEFPEIYFDRFGRPLDDAAGFDAVIGNPPYIRQEELTAYKACFASAYPAVHHGAADIFVYFFGQALQQLKQGGRTSYISSNSWLRANYATPLRILLRTGTTVETIVDFGDTRVFADAPDTSVAIHIVILSSPPELHTAQVAAFTRMESEDSFAAQVDAIRSAVSIHNQLDSGWQLGDNEGRHLFAKMMACGKALSEVVENRIHFGIKTGLNEAFIIDQQTRDSIVQAEASSARFIKKMLRAEDLRPWYQEDEGRWLIGIPYKWTQAEFGESETEKMTDDEAWNAFRERHPALAEYLAPFADAARARGDKGEYWWELRPCDYYPAFEQPKIFWPAIGKLPRFSWDNEGKYINNSGHILIADDMALLGILQSRAIWYAISQICTPLQMRAGLWRYQQFMQFIARLPIPDAPEAERAAIGQIAQALTEQAHVRYELHRKTRHRLLSDLGVPGKTLNQKLTAWYDLDFPALRAELQKVFKRDIPLSERDEWEAYFAVRRAEHAAQTAEIVRLETELNARVYALFDLTAAEIQTLEASVRYPYGEV